MNIKDVPPSTLVGLTWENPVLDPLAVLHLDNSLYSGYKVPYIGIINVSKSGYN